MDDTFEDEVGPVDTVLVSRLHDMLGFPDPWGCEESFDFSNHVIIVGEEQIAKTGSVHYDPGRRITYPLWHAARVVWLSRNETHMDHPIELVQDTTMGGVTIEDGWHRYYAHLFLKRLTIEVSFSGDLRILDYLTGESEELDC